MKSFFLVYSNSQSRTGYSPLPLETNGDSVPIRPFVTAWAPAFAVIPLAEPEPSALVPEQYTLV